MGSEWAVKSDLQLTELITAREIDKLCSYNSLSSAIKLAIPTPEHFLLVLYAVEMNTLKCLIKFIPMALCQ